jgi:hypothetical protein
VVGGGICTHNLRTGERPHLGDSQGLTSSVSALLELVGSHPDPCELSPPQDATPSVKVFGNRQHSLVSPAAYCGFYPGAPCKSRGPFGYPRLLPASCRPSHERGGLSPVQEYSLRRQGLSRSLAALFRCRRLIGRPSLRSCAIGLRGVEMSEEQKEVDGAGLEPATFTESHFVGASLAFPFTPR